MMRMARLLLLTTVLIAMTGMVACGKGSDKSTVGNTTGDDTLKVTLDWAKYWWWDYGNSDPTDDKGHLYVYLTLENGEYRLEVTSVSVVVLGQTNGSCSRFELAPFEKRAGEIIWSDIKRSDKTWPPDAPMTLVVLAEDLSGRGHRAEFSLPSLDQLPKITTESDLPASLQKLC
jgi:hypothetical protein